MAHGAAASHRVHVVSTSGVLPRAAGTRSQSRTRSSFGATRGRLSPGAFRLLWGLLVVFHLLNALLSLVMAMVHLLLSNPSYHESIKWIQISMATFSRAGWCYLVVTILHLVAAIKMMSPSSGCRGHSRRVGVKAPSSGPGALLPPTGPPRGIVARLVQLVRLGLAAFDRLMERVFGYDGYFGVNGKYFHVLFNSLELLEMLTQTYQAYQISRSVQRRWINDLAVIVVFLNGILMPVLMLTISSNERVRRVVQVVVDMIFDFFCAVVIPICVMAPHLLDYNFANHGFPRPLIFDDVWTSRAISEARLTLVTSETDLVTTMVPHINFLCCLVSVKKVLVLWSPRKSHRQLSVAKPSAPTPGIVPTVPTSRDWLRIAPELTSLREHVRNATRRSAKNPWILLFHVFTCIWSAAVLGIHLHAQRRNDATDTIPGCRLYLHPWMATNVSCSVMQVNCYGLGHVGYERDVAAALAGVERSILTKLILTHCAELRVPGILGEFHNLQSLEIYNSTLVDWSLAGRPTQGTHRTFNSLAFIYSNLSTIPEALLHDELPRSWEFFLALHSNLSQLPEAAGVAWSSHAWVRVALEHTLVTEFPASMQQLNTRGLYIVSSPIEKVPERLFPEKQLRLLRLSSPTLESLPESIGDTTALDVLMVENTNVTTLEPWVTAWLDRTLGRTKNYTVSFFGSPVCESLAGGPYASVCETYYFSDVASYPYDIIAAQRGLG